MLSRKDVGTALATTMLGTALALATGAAQAQDSVSRFVNLDALGTEASPYRTAKVARETLIGSTSETIFNRSSGDTFYKVYVAAENLRVRGSLGIRGDDNRQLFFRYDLGRAVWSVNLRDDMALIPDRDHGTPGLQQQALQLEVGGRRGQNYVIYSAPDNRGISSTSVVSLALHDKLAILPTGQATLSQSIFLGLSDAIAGSGGLRTKTAPVVEAVPSVATTAREETRRAEATGASGFTQLRDSGYNPLGGVRIRVGGPSSASYWDAIYNAQNGANTAVTLLSHVAVSGQVSATGSSGSLVTFRGNFSVGNFGSANTDSYSSFSSCSDGFEAFATRDAQGQTLDSVVLAATTGYTILCVRVPETNEDEIMGSEYKAAVAYRGLTNAAFAPANLEETRIGIIARAGMRVYIPYLTTFENYSQRIIIANRNDFAVPYSFIFRPEDGTTAMPGALAEGVVPAQGTLVMQVTDIVSLTGKTRTAGSIRLEVDSGIDIATTQVNLDDQSTDTLIYTQTEFNNNTWENLP